MYWNGALVRDAGKILYINAVNGNGVMVKQQRNKERDAREMRGGAKQRRVAFGGHKAYERKGKNGKLIKQRYPIHAACHLRSMIEKDLYELEPELWKQYSQDITEGLTQTLTDESGIPTLFFNKTLPTHLIGNANLTRACMDNRKFVYAKDAAVGLHMEVRTMKIENIAQPNGYAEPDPRMRYAFRNEGIQHDFVTAPIEEDLLKSKLEKNVRYMSTVLGNQNIRNQILSNLESYFKGTGLTQLDSAKIAMAIYSMTSNNTAFKHHDVSNSTEFRTLHYTVHAKNTSAEMAFELPAARFKIYVERKIVLASLNPGPNNNEAYTIPLCEEILVMPYKFTKNEYVLHEESCVIAAKLKLTTQSTQSAKTQNAQQWHFFGNNALTVHHADDHVIKTDPSSLTAFIAGFISGQMINISSNDLGKKTPAVNFFDGLFHDTTKTQVEEYGKRNIPKTSKIVESVISNLYKKHVQNLKERKEDKITTKDDFDSRVKTLFVPEKTFLANQKLGEMMHVIHGKYPRIKHFSLAFSFSLMVTSPHDNSSIKSVFVNTLPMWPENMQRTECTNQPSRIFDALDSTKPPAVGSNEVPAATAGEAAGSTAKSPVSFRPTRSHSVRNVEPEPSLRPARPHSARAVGSQYTSSLPPELELELELI